MQRTIVLLALATPMTASARPREANSNPLHEAVVRAVAYWGNIPCDGGVAVTAAPGTEAPTSGRNIGAPLGPAAMWATWDTRVGVNNLEQPPSTLRNCAVHINRDRWRSRRQEDARFPTFCKEMVHEYGHFEGRSDAGARPGTVEYERPDLARVPLCERYRLVYGHTIFKGSPEPRRWSTN
jgi:hypothetical protein